MVGHQVHASDGCHGLHRAQPGTGVHEDGTDAILAPVTARLGKSAKTTPVVERRQKLELPLFARVSVAQRIITSSQ
jgi:hypothetical protein